MSNGYLVITASHGNYSVTPSEHLTLDLATLKAQDKNVEVVRVYEFANPAAVETLVHGGSETRKFLAGWMIQHHGEAASVDDMCDLWGGTRLTRYETELS